MKIIPVLDILDGIAVHAIRGQRKKYRPLRSVLCRSAEPLDVASAFKSEGFDELYLADLDAIMGKTASFALYKKIIEKTDLELMIDAGINNMEKAREVIEAGAKKIIVGTETLSSTDFVGQAIESFGRDRVTVSIDLREGKVVSISEALRAMDPVSLAKRLERIGVAKTIILDLARVGSRSGVNLSVVMMVIEKTNIEVLTGGGIRGIEDLEELRNMGVSAVLVGTTLHTGELTTKELKSLGFM